MNNNKTWNQGRPPKSASRSSRPSSWTTSWKTSSTRLKPWSNKLRPHTKRIVYWMSRARRFKRAKMISSASFWPQKKLGASNMTESALTIFTTRWMMRPKTRMAGSLPSTKMDTAWSTSSRRESALWLWFASATSNRTSFMRWQAWLRWTPSKPGSQISPLPKESSESPTTEASTSSKNRCLGPSGLGSYSVKPPGSLRRSRWASWLSWEVCPSKKKYLGTLLNLWSPGMLSYLWTRAIITFST